MSFSSRDPSDPEFQEDLARLEQWKHEAGGRLHSLVDWSSMIAFGIMVLLTLLVFWLPCGARVDHDNDKKNDSGSEDDRVDDGTPGDAAAAGLQRGKQRRGAARVD